MNQQDEGWIDFSEADDAHEYVGGASEFARLEEGAGASLQRGLDQARSRELSDGPELGPQSKDTNPKDAIGGNKPNYSAVPVPVLYELGAALSEGARKYGGYNWRVAGVRASVYIDATRRHLDSWWEGEDIDPDSGLSHITKAIASLVVLRDAMIQGTLSNDDRPPRAAEFMPAMQDRMSELSERYPNPRPPYTEREVAHIRTKPSVESGRVLGYDVEIMLPATDAPEGFVWMQQGSRRTDLDLALSVAQALREDGYGERVIRIMEVANRLEVMADQTFDVRGELRRPVATVFPGDQSLTEMTEEGVADEGFACYECGSTDYLVKAVEYDGALFCSLGCADDLAASEMGEDGDSDEGQRRFIAEHGGGFDEYGNRVDPIAERGL